MPDRTPPDDLIDKLANQITQHADGPDALDTHFAELILAWFTEWADGALIDPTTWRAIEATEVGDGWTLNTFTAELSPWDPDDGAPPPENRVYTLTPRGAV